MQKNWQNLTPFMVKTLNQLGIEGNYLNIIKAIWGKCKANILNAEKLKAFSLRSGIRQGCSLAIFIQNSTRSPHHSK